MTEIQLADAINELRTQLKIAADQKAEKGLLFLVEEADIELKVTATKSAGADAKLKWLVIEIGASGKLATDIGHTVKLKLSPVVRSATGEISRLEINEPGGKEPR